MAKERTTAGPALAAPTPVRVRIPVPTIAPTPSATRCGQPRLRWSLCSGAMSSSATTALRANRFMKRPPVCQLDRQAHPPSKGSRYSLAHHIAVAGITANQEIPSCRRRQRAAHAFGIGPDHLGIMGDIAPADVLTSGNVPARNKRRSEAQAVPISSTE